MKPFRPLLLAGFLTAGVTALAGYAYAGQGGLKTLILQLPGGSVQQIQYAGATPPQIVILPQTAAMPVAMPTALLAPSMPAMPTDPFAQIDRISAIMDAQAAAMMSAMNVMMAQGMPGTMPGPDGFVPAAFGPLPPGASASYSFVSTSSAGLHGACMESVQMTTAGPGQAPEIVSRRAGDCAGGSPFLTRPAAAVLPQAAQAPFSPPVAPAPAPHLIRARAELPVPMPHPSQS